MVFLFAVGYELDLKVLGERARTVLTVAVAAFLVPMAVGSGAALLFREQLHALGVSRLSPAVVVFAGIALSITAVPVLTAMVRENGLASTVPGMVAVSAAGLMDVVGWTVLAGTLLDGAGEQSLGPGWRAAAAVVFIGLMLVVARPLLRGLLWRTRLEPLLRLSLLIAFAFGSACVTQYLGLHAICGALLAGVVCPREANGTLDPDLLRPLHDISSLLLPFFFVFSGQAVVLNSLTASGWVAVLVTTALAVTTKIGSGTAAARLGGLGRDDARTVGVLLNTRGLTELIALNAGYQAGLLSKPLYTVLVLMALATTLLTQPLLLLVDRLSASRPDTDTDDRPGVLVGSRPADADGPPRPGSAPGGPTGRRDTGRGLTPAGPTPPGVARRPEPGGLNQAGVTRRAVGGVSSRGPSDCATTRTICTACATCTACAIRAIRVISASGTRCQARRTGTAMP
ncbi:hypothetical protein SVIOM342S_10545 [Streptomyces violaceorubidus]